MKTLWTWATANPFWATVILIAFITALVLLVKFLTKDKAPEAPAEPAEPNPEPAQRLGWQRAFTTPVISGGTAGVSSGAGAGMSGGRFSAGKS